MRVFEWAASRINMNQIQTTRTPERIPGLFTDPSLATRKMPCQRLLLKAHVRSARKWGALAENAPAVSDLIGLCFRRIQRDAVEYFRGGAGDEISAKRNRAAFKEVYLNP